MTGAKLNGIKIRLDNAKRRRQTVVDTLERDLFKLDIATLIEEVEAQEAELVRLRALQHAAEEMYEAGEASRSNGAHYWDDVVLPSYSDRWLCFQKAIIDARAGLAPGQAEEDRRSKTDVTQQP